MNIFGTERHDVAGYKRLAVDAVEQTVTDDDLLAVAGLQLHEERVGAVVVFVWSTAERVGQQPWDVARIQLARSDKCWSGDGRWVVGTALEERGQRRHFRRRRYVNERRERAKRNTRAS